MKSLSTQYLGENIVYEHFIFDKLPNTSFHLHDWCEIYFPVSGDIRYFIDKNVYSMKFGDLIISNKDELHRVSFLSQKVYERITIAFNPSAFIQYNTPDFDVLHCFLSRSKGENNKICLSQYNIDNIMELFIKLENLFSNPSKGTDVLIIACFVELLVVLNRAFLNSSSDNISSKIPEKLIPILDYIDANLEKELTIEVLGEIFFINKYYLSKLFKKVTGSKLHEYIVNKRIAKAKKLLCNGYNVTEAAEMTGFNNYCSFIKTFKKIVGTSPGKYGKNPLHAKNNQV